jgi:hypothetical protein
MRKDIKKKTIYELAQEHPDKTYRELEKYRDADRYEEAQQISLTEKQKEVGIATATKKDRTYPDFTEVLAIENDKLKKKGHELLMELNETKVLLKGNKGIVEEYHRDNMTLKEHLDEAKRTIKNLEIRLAESLEVNESHQKLNGKLQERLTEVEEDNKKLAHQITGKLNHVRKAGL